MSVLGFVSCLIFAVGIVLLFVFAVFLNIFDRSKRMNEQRKYSGIPMSEERLKAWKKVFSDIDESTEALHKQSSKKKVSKNKTK